MMKTEKIDSSSQETAEQEIKELSEEEDYLYSSSEEEDLEKDYFGEIEEESGSEEGAWEDSESEEEALRKKHKTTAMWINDKQPKREIEVRKKRLSYKFSRFVFKTNFNIKIMKECSNFVVLVDTMNCVYLLQEDKLIKSFKVEKFRIDEVIGFNKKIYLINSKCGHLKEINEDLNIDTIEKKFVRNMRRAFANEYLYIMGDTTIVVNKKLNCISEYHDKLISIGEYNSKLVAINSLGDVLIFTKELKLEKKLVFDVGVSFSDVYAFPDQLVVNSNCSMFFLNENYEIIKDTPHLKNPVKNIVFHSEHFFCFSSAKGGLKILNSKLNFDNSFPKKKIRLPETSLAISCNEGIMLASHRDLHLLRINYE